MPDQVIDVADLHIGDDVTARYKPDGNRGQGGIVVRVEPDQVVLCSGTARVQNVISLDLVHHWTKEVPFDAEECLNYSDECSGPVEMRWPGSGWKSWPRCEFHGEKRLANVSELERYADSDVAPSWFDPSYAGERWDED